MIYRLHLVFLFLFIFFSAIPESTAQVDHKKVTLYFHDIPLEAALKKIKAQCGVNFSYSPDLINLRQLVSLNVRNATLEYALNQLFHNLPITYRIVGNQVVLKKSKSVVPSGNTAKSSPPLQIAVRDSVYYPEKDTTALQVPPSKSTEVITTDSTLVSKGGSYSQVLTNLNDTYTQKKDSIAIEAYSSKMKLRKSWKEAKLALSKQYKFKRDSMLLARKNKYSDTITDIDADLLIHDDFQFTAFYPLGNHSSTSGLYRNDYSLNFLFGYNGAVSKAEVGLLANIVRKEVQGVQVAGLANACGEYVRGAQFAGLVNISNQEVIGGQFAGVVNVANGAMAGVQAAGVVNVGVDKLDGVQAAFVVNQHNGEINGGQIGLINNAHKVKGFQFGLINVCDTINGLPFGLLSICKNGYGRIEAYYSETTPYNIMIKSGVKSLYNIFQFGGNFNSSYYRWTFGYGLGSTVQLSKQSTITIDVTWMHLNENEGFTNALNEQLQTRVLLALNLTKRLSVFAGPTLNTTFSNYINSSGSVGSQMIPKRSILYEHNIAGQDGRTIYNAYWLGFNAGIRF
ncbi:MAG: STN domain-containing protein [Cytophaga sp.]|uniref:STN domain-containing protein n=1 Tax=Cytophaga sp. TaxID=29535 RepID=UPI003F806E8D